MDVSEVLVAIVLGIFLFLPALVPNSAAVLFGGGTPIDFGKTWRGKRILGDGKTWGGLIGGVASGTALGIILIVIAYFFDPADFWGYGSFPQNVGIVFTLALGSLLGDMCGAFIKRRLGMERGQKAPVLDQYDFVAGAMLVTCLFFPDWFISTYISGTGLISLVTVLILVPVLHRSVNIIGFKMGKKKEPW